MLKLYRLDPAGLDWSALDQFEDRTVFQTREWLDFIAETQDATPVVAELRQGSSRVGYFTGLIVRRMGIRILGSSFPGWTTPYIGFNLQPGISRREALKALEDFAFRDLRCLHLEVSDRGFAPEDGEQLGFAVDAYRSYETDLRLAEEELFNQMTSACRRCIRKAEKSGVRIEEAHDDRFAIEYYEQLKDVFAKQTLVPTYDIKRVRSLVHHLLPTGRLLLLRALDPEGRSIGTGIYPGMNKVAQFWGNASFRHSQQLRPNESLHWYAMRYWKRQGIEIFDWGGGGEYKEKYGGKPSSVPWFRKPRYAFLGAMRKRAKGIYDMKQRLMGRLQGAGEGNGE
jgi:Acetyltransferase (GNAT) domain